MPNNDQNDNGGDARTEKVTEPATRRSPNKQGVTGGRKASPHILRRYDDMWEAWKQQQTIAHVARSVGCGRETARRAINEGYPAFNLPSLREKWTQMRESAESMENYDLSARLRDTLRYGNAIDKLVADVVQELEKADFTKLFSEQALEGAGPEEVVKILDKLAKIVERTAKLKAWIAGKPTEVREIREKVDIMAHIHRVQQMDDAELDRVVERATAKAVRAEHAVRAEQSRREVEAWTQEQLARFEPAGPLLPAACST